jgi:hypothetical protein
MSAALRLAGALSLAASLAGCQEAMQQLNRDLAALNNAPKPGTMARMPEGGKDQQTQLIVPADTRVREAMEAALPTVKKVLAIHQCVKTHDGLLQLNQWAVPGADLRRWGQGGSFPNHYDWMRYHDRNKCVGVRAIDNWSMPALNALRFRAVFFADDSGETINFTYLLKRTDDGSWLVETFRQGS